VTHLFFEFHCRSEDNERRIASGHNDPDLSPHGIAEAEAMADRYAGREIDAVYSSDLLRARRTVGIAFRQRGLPILFDARIRECDYGELNGAPVEEVHDHRAEYATKPFPGGESFADVVARVEPLLAEVKAAHEGGTVVIIGHSAIYFALEVLLKGRDLQTMLGERWRWMDVWHWEAEL
jgi:broad specificity phosphatase PhoE